MRALSLTLAALCLLATIAATVLAVRAVGRLLRVLRAGQPDHGRLTPVRSRAVSAFVEIVTHRRIGRSRIAIGAAHWLVMVGFCSLIPNVLMAYVEVLAPSAGLPLLAGFGPYELLVEVMAVATVVGILVLIVVRQVLHQRRLGRRSRFFGSQTGYAYFVEAVVLAEGLSVLGIRAVARACGYAEGPAWTAPVSTALGGVVPASATLLSVMAAVKILIAMGWIAVVATRPTMGIAWHRFTAPVNVYAKRDIGRPALGAARPMMSGGTVLDLEQADPDTDVFGAGAIDQFSWKGLLDFVSCTECGRCQQACPAFATDQPLSPKAMVMALRHEAFAPTERPLVGQLDECPVLDADALWACTTCGACVQQCPVDIEHVDHVIDMRRHQVLMESQFPAELAGTFRNLELRGNPWGQPARERMAWADGLDFAVPQVSGPMAGDVEYLLWVGCAGAFDERAKATTRAVAELLHLAGVSFAVLGQRESCCGDAARRTGNEPVYQDLAGRVIAALDLAFGDRPVRDRVIVTACPHCLNVIGNEYPQLGAQFTVLHHTQVLNRLVRSGRLRPVPGDRADQELVTYHDPCYLGRHNQVYEQPRQLLETVGRLVEVPRNRQDSMCCGAGGGRMFTEQRHGTPINAARVAELVAAGQPGTAELVAAGQPGATGQTGRPGGGDDPKVIATACPFCRTMVADGVDARREAAGPDTPRETGRPEAAGQPEVRDVAQLLLDAVRRGARAATTDGNQPDEGRPDGNQPDDSQHSKETPCG